MRRISKKLRHYVGNKIRNPLFAGSMVMIVGSNLANIFSYLYHVVMGRLLQPFEYGTLVALFSLITLITSSYGFLALVIVKFVSASEEKDINKLFTWFTRKSVILGVILAVGILLSSPFLSSFLDIDIFLILLLSPLLFMGVIAFVYRSFLQGLLRFVKLAIVMNVNLAGRLILGAFFVLLGYSVFGAALGLLLISIISVMLLRYFLKDIKIVNIKRYRIAGKVFNYTKERGKYSSDDYHLSVKPFQYPVGLRWNFVVQTYGHNGEYIADKTFKTKTQAVKYAKNYMKKH